MDKKSLYLNISDRYKQCVIGPANPFTVDNPDALIFNGKSLIGLYIPLAKEVSNPDLLLRRLFLSRLAMCNSLRTVLLLSEKESFQLFNNEQIIASFDDVHVFNGIIDFLGLLKETKKTTPLIDKRLKQEKIKKFWGTIDFLDRNDAFKDNYSCFSFSKGVTARSWSSPESNRISKRTSFKNECLITSKGITKQSFKEGFEDIMTFSTMFNYSLSGGNLKRIANSNEVFMCLNIENPNAVIKNEIDLRTLVFLGYLPCRVNEYDDIKRLNDRYYDFMKAGKYL